MYFLFLSKFINFYLGRQNKKPDKKQEDVKNNKKQEIRNKMHIVNRINLSILI